MEKPAVIYRLITEADTPSSLHSVLADKLVPVLNTNDDVDKTDKDTFGADDWAYLDYRHFFKSNQF